MIFVELHKFVVEKNIVSTVFFFWGFVAGYLKKFSQNLLEKYLNRHIFNVAYNCLVRNSSKPCIIVTYR